MAGDDKQIKFVFKVDEQSLNKLRTSIREINKDMEALVRTASGLSLGGGRVAMGGGGSVTGQSPTTAIKTQAQQGAQGGGLAQAFIDSSKAMSNMANVSKDSLRIMSDSVRRGIDEQKRSISSLDADLAKLAKRYDDLASYKAKAMSQGMDPNRSQMSMDVVGRNVLTTEGQRQAASTQLGQLQAQQASIAAAQSPAGAGGGGGIMSRIPSFLPGGGGGGAMGIGSSLAAIMAVANFGLNENRAGTRQFATESGKRADLVTGRMQALRGGDYKASYAMQTLSGMAKEDVMSQTMGIGSGLEQGRRGLEQFAGSVPLVGGMLRKAGVVGEDTGGGALGAITTGNRETDRVKKAFDVIDSEQKANIMQNMAMDKFQANRGSRIGAQRMLGISGFGVQDKLGNRTDAYSQLETSLGAQAYSVDEYAGAHAGLRQSAGRQFANKMAYSAMAAQSTGLGGFGEMAGAAARAGGLGGGRQFAFGALGGGIDQAAGVQLGGAIIGQGFDVRGTTSGLGMLGAAQAGMGFTGGVGDFNKVNQLQAGMGLGNQVVGGGLDAYQQARNLTSAMRIKPGADVYTQDYLANGMNTRQMMDAIRGGGTTETMKQLGISGGDVRSQMGASISSVLEERMPGMDKNSAMGKAMAKYKASGQDLPGYLSGLKGKEKEEAVKSLGVAFGLATGEGEEAGIGLLGAEAGLDEKTALKLGKVGKKLTGGEAADTEARMEKEKTINAELLRIHDDFLKAIKSSTSDFTKMEAFGTNLDAAADKFIAAIGKMTWALENKFGVSGTTVKAAPNGSNIIPGGGKSF